MNPFHQASNHERVRLNELLASRNINATHTDETGYSVYDATFITPTGVTYYIETKCRKNKLDKYPDHLLEEKKANALLALHLQNPNSKVWYINFFHNGYIIFDITERIKNQSRLKVDTRSCNVTTAVDNGTTNKKVYLLDVESTDLKYYTV